MAEFSIRYLGEKNPEDVPANELIAVLSALNEICTRASTSLYGDEDKHPFRIAAVTPGSISIEGIISAIASMQPIFAQLPALSFGVENIPQLIRAWFNLSKFLKGKPPTQVQKVSNGDAVQITNRDGNVTIVNGNIYNSFQFHNIGKRSKRLQAPIRRGARALQILEDKIEIAKFEKEDTQWLQDVSDPKQVDSEIDAILEIKAPLLDGRGLWKFKYGRTSLSARIDDQEFMERVNNSAERFAHGDKFHVRLRTRQLQEGDRIKTEHSVSRIIARVSS